jgi:hypothetical protein
MRFQHFSYQFNLQKATNHKPNSSHVDLNIATTIYCPPVSAKLSVCHPLWSPQESDFWHTTLTLPSTHFFLTRTMTHWFKTKTESRDQRTVVWWKAADACRRFSAASVVDAASTSPPSRDLLWRYLDAWGTPLQREDFHADFWTVTKQTGMGGPHL